MSKPLVTTGLTPFSLHIFWDGREGRTPQSLYTRYVKAIYEFSNRAENDPLNIYLGIPVYLHPEPVTDVKNVVGQSSEYSCSLVFMDALMVEEEQWLSCLQGIKRFDDNSTKHLFLPLSLTKKIPSTLTGIHYLKLKNADFGIEELLIRVAHNIYQHLEENTPEDTATAQSNTPKEPMQIFISHAKADGKPFAKGLKDRIDDIPRLKSYYDAKNISWGFSFGNQIETGIARSVLLVLHTDQFSSREWCRQEVIYAKRHDRPILVVNRFKQGETRSFPYLGNVPHLRFSEGSATAEGEKKMYNLVLLSVIAEGLRLRISDLSIRMLTKKLGVKVGRVFKYPPELLTIPRKETQKEAIIIYPDPPIGQSEQVLLKEFYPHLTFITPTFLPLLSADGKNYDDLSGLRVGLSLSEIKGQAFEWIDNNIIQDVTTALTRYLLVGGAVIHYGGSLHYDQANEKTYNFVELLKRLVQTYRNDFAGGESPEIKPIENYTFVPASSLLKVEEKEAMENLVNFHEIPINKIFKLSDEQAMEVSKLDRESRNFGLFEKRTIWSVSLMELRHKMLEKEDARVVLGGKWISFIGRMSGILEEVLIALDQQKPLYVLGGFGGVSAGIAACLQGEIPEELKEDYYFETDPAYISFLKKFNEHALVKKLNAQVSYPAIADFIRESGRSKDDFGLNNGLNRAENLRLFYSKSIVEIICLILKGMHILKLKNDQ